jgi:hypothetical protein
MAGAVSLIELGFEMKQVWYQHGWGSQSDRVGVLDEARRGIDMAYGWGFNSGVFLSYIWGLSPEGLVV